MFRRSDYDTLLQAEEAWNELTDAERALEQYEVDGWLTGEVTVVDLDCPSALCYVFADGSAVDEDLEHWTDWRAWLDWFVTDRDPENCRLAVVADAMCTLDLAARIAVSLEEAGQAVTEIETPFTD